jgi:hypothetical protein
LSRATVAFATEVAGLAPSLSALFEEHVTANFGEVLPHLFLSDVARRVNELVRAVSSGGGNAARSELKSILDALETGYATGPHDVQELIAASFLENLPYASEPGSEVRGMLGPSLKMQLGKMS